MKQTRSVFCLVLAFIVLTASVGVTMNEHLCGGEVQSTAFFGKAEPCGMMGLIAHSSAKHPAKRSHCCDERTIVFKSKEQNASITVKVSLVPEYNLISTLLPVLYSILPSATDIVMPALAYGKPPLPDQDITVLIHSFLI